MLPNFVSFLAYLPEVVERLETALDALFNQKYGDWSLWLQIPLYKPRFSDQAGMQHTTSNILET